MNDHSQSGFALMATLWLLVVLAAASAMGFGAATLEVRTIHNRVLLARAEWAREACVELAKGVGHSGSEDHPERDDGGDTLIKGLGEFRSVPLGEMLRCELTVEDLGAKIDVNASDPMVLSCITGDSVTTAALLRTRPISSLGALADSVDDRVRYRSLTEYLTVYGTGQININTAPSEVLACLPGVGPVGAASMVAARINGWRFRTLDDVVAALPLAIRTAVNARYPEFSRAAVISAPRLLLRATGIAGVLELRATAAVIASRAGDGIQVLWRETE